MALPPPRRDFGCIADLCVDLVVRGEAAPRYNQEEVLFEGYELELGGSAAIAAAQFAKLGGAVRLLGAVGDDAFGRFVLARLREEGLPTDDVAVRRDLPTGLGVAFARRDGDRAICTVAGALDGTPAELLGPGLAGSCRHWHLAAVGLLAGLRPAWARFAAACHAAGATVSLDPNWVPDGDWEPVRELLPQVDVFLPNEREALAVAGCDDVDAAGEALSRRCALVVIKRGEHGSVAWRDGARIAQRGGQPVAQVVDAVGAGDCFDAGFLRAWLAGAGPSACLALGDRCARASLARAGGFRGQLKELAHAAA